MRNGIAVVAMLLTVGLVLGQEPVTVVKKLAVKPAAAPVPALKYALLPEVGDLTPGNAVPLYYRALLPDALTHVQDKELVAKLDQWAKTALADLPLKEMAWLNNYRPLQDCDAAARREQCDWELIPRLRKHGLAASVSEVQSLRTLARLLVLRARMEMASGQPEKALQSVQTLLALSRHAGEGPTVINALVGMACTGMAVNVLEELIQLPDAPNLYWSLTALPRPFIDLRKAMQGEKLMVIHSLPTLAALPDLRDVETRPLTARQVEQLAKEVRVCFLLVDGIPAKAEGEIDLDTAVAKLLPAARKDLIAAGHKPAEIEKLPALQVVAASGMRQVQRLHDDSAKLVELPYWQARPHFMELDKRRKANLDPMAALIPSFALTPGVNKIALSRAILDRRIAALRCLEAVRLHAAANGGKPPAKLADVRDAPVAIDPVTGKEFEYKVDGDKVSITGPAPEGEAASRTNILVLEISLRR